MVREAIAHAVPGERKPPVREKPKLTPALDFTLCASLKKRILPASSPKDHQTPEKCTTADEVQRWTAPSS